MQYSKKMFSFLDFFKYSPFRRISKMKYVNIFSASDFRMMISDEYIYEIIFHFQVKYC